MLPRYPSEEVVLGIFYLILPRQAANIPVSNSGYVLNSLPTRYRCVSNRLLTGDLDCRRTGLHRTV